MSLKLALGGFLPNLWLLVAVVVVVVSAEGKYYTHGKLCRNVSVYIRSPLEIKNINT